MPRPYGPVDPKTKIELPPSAPLLLGGVALEHLAAVAALAHLLPVVEEGVADAPALVALGATPHPLFGPHWSFLLDDARLPGACPAPRVLLDDVYALYNYLVIRGVHLAHPPALSSILAGYHQHSIISLDIHRFLQSTATKSWERERVGEHPQTPGREIPAPLQYLWRERDNLHELLLAQLAGHRAEDARAARSVLGSYDHRRVVIEADVRPIRAQVLFGRSH